MVTVAVGTEKGAFLLRSTNRTEWDVSAPLHPGWRITTFGRSPGGDHLLASGSNWFGASIHRSPDLEAWEQVVDGPTWPAEAERKLNNVWTIHRHGDRLFAGVDEAGLFTSDDDGSSWEPVAGLNEHESRHEWFPGFGGLAAHRILTDPNDANRVWVGISAVGVFASEDGGASWELRNSGLPRTVTDAEFDVGYCVHSLVADPADPETIWRQDHRGVFRTTDGGRNWERIENGLPSGFGFPIGRDAASGALFVVPQESDQHRMPVDARFLVYRSTDGGDSWEAVGNGLPEEPIYDGVLRDAMDTDGDGGVYLGTTGGRVHWTADAGESWGTIAATFPRVLSVKVLED